MMERRKNKRIKNNRNSKRKEETFRRDKLPGQFMARKLFGWSDKKYDEEYWARLKRN